MKHDYSDQIKRFKEEQKKQERAEFVISAIVIFFALSGIAGLSVIFWRLI